MFDNVAVNITLQTIQKLLSQPLKNLLHMFLLKEFLKNLSSVHWLSQCIGPHQKTSFRKGITPPPSGKFANFIGELKWSDKSFNLPRGPHTPRRFTWFCSQKGKITQWKPRILKSLIKPLILKLYQWKRQLYCALRTTEIFRLTFFQCPVVSVGVSGCCPLPTVEQILAPPLLN